MGGDGNGDRRWVGYVDGFYGFIVFGLMVFMFSGFMAFCFYGFVVLWFSIIWQCPSWFGDGRLTHASVPNLPTEPSV